ncbi:hypothetical protein FACS189429_2730 [Bacteroidia bacterium]|nr:hypothetical protein FACS189429_2730 [Bacteroidia bacterium]GHV43731.1 hypothetical protein FACS1894180_3680 [Bacteroidia bacterium]
MKKLFNLSMLITIVILGFSSCKDKEEPRKEYTVKFDSQGGSVVADIKVMEGEKIAKPADPSKEGFIFGGWYKEANCQTKWIFGQDLVSSNITLYAGWTEIDNEVFYAEPGLLYYTDENGVANVQLIFINTRLFDEKGDFAAPGNMYSFDCYFKGLVETGTHVYGPAAAAYTVANGDIGEGYVTSFNEMGDEIAETMITAATINIEKNGNIYIVTATVIDELGVESDFFYEGELAIVDARYDAEFSASKEPVNATFTYTYANENMGVDATLGTNDYVYMVVHKADNDDSEYAGLSYFVPNGATSIPAGTYTLDGDGSVTTGDLNTVWAGMFTFLVTTPGKDVYYPWSGTCTFTENGWTLNATSYFGTPINISYTGSMDFKPFPERTDVSSKALQKPTKAKSRNLETLKFRTKVK